MRIEVTALELARGERNKCSRCPIALAIVRCVPGAYLAMVNASEVIIYRKEEETPQVVLTPDRAANFVGRFDLGLPCAPFAFELPLKGAPCSST